MRDWAKRLLLEVVERDEGACILCRAPMWEVHHIIPRGRKKPFSRETWRIDNLACICRTHHNDGQKTWMRIELLETMVELYDYDMMWVKEFGVAWPPDAETLRKELTYAST